MSAVTLTVDRVGIEELEDGYEGGAFSWVILRKFQMSSRVSRGELSGTLWEIKDLLMRF